MKTKHYTINSKLLAQAMALHYARKCGRAYLQGQVVESKASKGEILAIRAKALIKQDRGE